MSNTYTLKRNKKKLRKQLNFHEAVSSYHTDSLAKIFTHRNPSNCSESNITRRIVSNLRDFQRATF